MSRFDPWQNRPDRPAARWRPVSRRGGGRSVVIWVAAFLVLTVGYRYGHELALVAKHTLAGWFPSGPRH